VFPDANSDDADRLTFSRTWVEKTQPYVKSLPIFQSPFDSHHAATVASWATGFVPDGFKSAIGISYSPNGYMHSPDSAGWTSNCGPTPPYCVFGGVMNQNDNGGYGPSQTKTQTQVTQPAGTILLADMFSSDVIKDGSGFANLSEWFTDAFLQVRVPNDVGYLAYGWFAPEAIPNAQLSPTNSAPNGPNGGVSITKANMSNFAFVDGHSKSMVPAATDPDPVNNRAANMWDADR